MADLSFFDYKKTVLAEYTAAKSVTPFDKLTDTEFYSLSFHNRTMFELEYQLLETVLKTKHLPQRFELEAAYYLETLAHFLARDARIAGNTAEEAKYLGKIKAFATVSAVPMPSTETEFRKSLNQFYQDCSDFLSTPFHVSKVITLLSYLNLYRLLTLFSRLSCKSFWTLAQDNHWIDANNHLLGRPINRSILDNTADLFNFLSVSLFALRLVAHLSMIVKHATSQREGEKDIHSGLRAFQEFYVRMAHIMNDIVWLIINFLTNYPSLSGISDPLANTLLVCTLVYDSLSLVALWYVKEKEWFAQHQALIGWKSKGNANLNRDEMTLTDLNIVLLKDLRFEMRVKYAFSILAGLSIMTSYLLVLALASPAVSTLGFFMCVVGFGMYASADDFAAWMRALFGEMKIENEAQQAQTAFFSTWSKSTFTPLLMVGLVTVSWELALLAMVAVAVRPYIPKWESSVANQTTGHESSEHGLLSVEDSLSLSF